LWVIDILLGMNFYRFLSGERGIYEAVDIDCPKDIDERRKNKPDGSWLPKVGQKYPGAIFLDTEGTS
jgi:hypothetical protein